MRSRTKRRWWARSLVLSLAAAMAACSGPEKVRIIGECEVEGEATLLLSGQPPGPFGPAPSAGIVDGKVMLSWVEGLEGPYDIRGQWYDESLEPMGEPVYFGAGFGYRSQWVASDGALHGQVWADPTPDTEDITEEGEYVHLWRVTPDSAEATQTVLDTSDSSDAGLVIGFNPTAGVEAIIPSAVVGGELIGGAIAIPSECRHLGNNSRLFLARRGGRSGVVFWKDELCSADIGIGEETDTPWLFDIDDRNVGALVRIRAGVKSPIHLVRIPRDGAAPSAPRLVGTGFTSIEGGNQPRAVRLGGRLLFTEVREVRGSNHNRCHALRIAGLDGSEARDAPWQLPCLRGQHVTSMVELFRIHEEAAVLVWNQHTWARPYVTSDVDWQEGVFAALVTAEGERGSPIIEVTDTAATALSDVMRTADRGPVERNFYIGAAASGTHAVVVWTDSRSSAPGVYGRRITCRADP